MKVLEHFTHLYSCLIVSTTCSLLVSSEWSSVPLAASFLLPCPWATGNHHPALSVQGAQSHRIIGHWSFGSDLLNFPARQKTQGQKTSVLPSSVVFLLSDPTQEQQLLGNTRHRSTCQTSYSSSCSLLPSQKLWGELYILLRMRMSDAYNQHKESFW